MANGSNTFTVTSVTLKRRQRIQRKRRPSNEELARRIDELEQTYYEQLKIVVEAIRRLMRPPARKRNAIGPRSKMRKK
jgi:hypothetical protein